MSMKNFMLILAEHEKKNITSGPVHTTLTCLSKILKDHGHNFVFSFLSSGSISVLSTIDTEAYKYYDSTKLDYAKLLISVILYVLSVHSLIPKKGL